jgi:hypothetical protein
VQITDCGFEIYISDPSAVAYRQNGGNNLAIRPVYCECLAGRTPGARSAHHHSTSRSIRQ